MIFCEWRSLSAGGSIGRYGSCEGFILIAIGVLFLVFSQWIYAVRKKHITENNDYHILNRINSPDRVQQISICVYSLCFLAVSSCVAIGATRAATDAQECNTIAFYLSLFLQLTAWVHCAVIVAQLEYFDFFGLNMIIGWCTIQLVVSSLCVASYVDHSALLLYLVSVHLLVSVLLFLLISHVYMRYSSAAIRKSSLAYYNTITFNARYNIPSLGPIAIPDVENPLVSPSVSMESAVTSIAASPARSNRGVPRSNTTPRWQDIHIDDSTIASLSVTEWEYYNFFERTIIVYKLKCEPGAGAGKPRVIEKRYDEIELLHNTISADYPCRSFPSLPDARWVVAHAVNSDEEIAVNSVARRPPIDILAMHRDSINRYLTDMMQIPLAGPAFFNALCSGAKLVPQSTGSARSATTPALNDLTPTRAKKNKSETQLPPIYSFQPVAAAVKVTNWAEVDGETYFIIEISQQAEFAHKRIVRKKYKQFKSLHAVLNNYNTSHKHIKFPMPGSSGTTRTSDNNPPPTPEEKIKVRGKRAQHKLISELNAYLQNVCELQPVPDVVTAFLESDITSISSGYDIVVIKNEAHIIDQDQQTYLAKAGQVSYLTNCYTQESTPALNALGEEWYHADSRETLHESLVQSNMIDAIGLAEEDGVDAEESMISVVSKALTMLLTLLRFFVPDGDDAELLSGKDLRIIDVGVSSETARPTWLLQWRLNRMVLATSAFADFSVLVSKLKNFSLKSLKKHNDDEKAAFYVNLYNCMSLHAALLLRWPDVTQSDARVTWQHHARYNIGGVKISLLSIEYNIIRPVLGAIKYPTVPHSNVVVAQLDPKLLQIIVPNTIDARVLFALSLPCSPHPVQVYSGYIFQRQLVDLVSTILRRTVICNAEELVLYLPKLLRRNTLLFANHTKWSRANQIYATSVRIDSGASSDGSSNQSIPKAKEGAAKRSVVASTEWDTIILERTATPRVRSKAPLNLDETIVGDSRITEAELSHFHSYLQNNVEIKDRAYHFKTYKDCFLGREAVACFTGNSTICKSLPDAIRIGNILVEHVVNDHWFKNQDLFYTFCGAPPPSPQAAYFVSFLLDHFEGRHDNHLGKQIHLSLDGDYAVVYVPDDCRFRLTPMFETVDQYV